jgi:chromosome segregation ATPase
MFEASLKQKEEDLNNMSFLISKRVSEEEHRLASLRGECNEEYQKLHALKEEAKGINDSVTSKLVDAQAKLSSIIHDVEIQESVLSEVKSRIEKECTEEENLKRRKERLGSEVGIHMIK